MGLEIFDTGGLEIFGDTWSTQQTFSSGIKTDTIDEATSGTGVTIDGLKIENDGTTTDLLGTAGDYIRIGDAGTTAHSLNSEDDLMGTGDFEVKGTAWFDGSVTVADVLTIATRISSGDNDYYGLGSGDAGRLLWQTSDGDANLAALALSGPGNNDVPVLLVGPINKILTLDVGLFDGVTQPVIALMEKGGKYTFSSSGTHDGSDTDELTETGKFAASVVGDIIRLVSGTNITPGFYFIHDVTDNDNVNLDRAFVTGGAASNVVYVAYHNIQILAVDGITIPIKNSDFSASDFEFLGGVRLGWRDDLEELQIVKMDGTMKSIVLI